MTRSDIKLRGLALAAIVALAAIGCKGGTTPDAYGNFEATEVVVSAQTSGQIERFTPVEGMQLAAGADVAIIDTTQLALQQQQIEAQRNAANERETQAARQLNVLLVQRDVSQRTYERTQRLKAEQAATAQQLDQAEREYRTLLAQIEVAKAQTRSVGMEAASADAQVAQIRERIMKSRVTNPTAGTVLTTYARAGEMVQPGTPLYRIANLDTLELRAYVSEPQLSSFRVGQTVNVHVDNGGSMMTLPGTISWVSSRSEFTPTPVQTRDERADLVYAIKVRVANHAGALKIGMPADLSLGGAPTSSSPAPSGS
ncbi:MAG: HlyD family efflux transporter periplasmic adaptor subunit [Gemmatimonadaceae bacterium]